MMCPICGVDVGELARLCDTCQGKQSVQRGNYAFEGTPTKQPSNEIQGSTGSYEHAGFWLRFLAMSIDISLLGMCYYLVNYFLFGVYDWVANFFVPAMEPQDISSGFFATLMFGYFGGMLVWAIVTWLLCLILGQLYYPLMESSSVQGTLGKRFFGLIVTDSEFKPVSFKRSFVRNLLKGIPIFIYIVITGIGMLVPVLSSKFDISILYFHASAVFLLFMTSALVYFMAAVTSNKQGLHDLISGCYVVRNESISGLRLVIGIILALVLPSLVPKSSNKSDTSSTIRVKKYERIDRNINSTNATIKPKITTNQQVSRKIDNVSSAPPPPPPPPEKSFKPLEKSKSTFAVDDMMFDVGSSVVLFYPSLNKVSIGFYVQKISQKDISRIKRNRYLWSSQNKILPEVTVTFAFHKSAKIADINKLDAYYLSIQKKHLGIMMSMESSVNLSPKLDDVGNNIKLSGKLKNKARIVGSFRGLEKHKETNSVVRWNLLTDTEMHVIN